MDHCYGFKIPKTMQKEFADVIQKISEVKGRSFIQQKLWKLLKRNILDIK